mmetsp:Transcript_29449/g.49541  ORF Transcript_29449/g.49541 Transcript_29449/m.49541 type:complete len:290 (+) Transcript_29449:664-1533(+)
MIRGKNGVNNDMVGHDLSALSLPCATSPTHPLTHDHIHCFGFEDFGLAPPVEVADFEAPGAVFFVEDDFDELLFAGLEDDEPEPVLDEEGGAEVADDPFSSPLSADSLSSGAAPSFASSDTASCPPGGGFCKGREWSTFFSLIFPLIISPASFRASTNDSSAGDQLAAVVPSRSPIIWSKNTKVAVVIEKTYLSHRGMQEANSVTPKTLSVKGDQKRLTLPKEDRRALRLSSKRSILLLIREATFFSSEFNPDEERAESTASRVSYKCCTQSQHARALGRHSCSRTHSE